MKIFLTIALSLLICSAAADRAFALSDADHNAFMKSSPVFAQAEKRLNNIWKAIKAANGNSVPSPVVSEQQAWIKHIRDSEARVLFDKMPQAEAYAKVTNERSDSLERLYLKKQPAPTEHSNNSAIKQPEGKSQNQQIESKKITQRLKVDALDLFNGIYWYKFGDEFTEKDSFKLEKKLYDGKIIYSKTIKLDGIDTDIKIITNNNIICGYEYIDLYGRPEYYNGNRVDTYYKKELEKLVNSGQVSFNKEKGEYIYNGIIFTTGFGIKVENPAIRFLDKFMDGFNGVKYGEPYLDGVVEKDWGHGLKRRSFDDTISVQTLDDQLIGVVLKGDFGKTVFFQYANGSPPPDQGSVVYKDKFIDWMPESTAIRVYSALEEHSKREESAKNQQYNNVLKQIDQKSASLSGGYGVFKYGLSYDEVSALIKKEYGDVSTTTEHDKQDGLALPHTLQFSFINTSPLIYIEINDQKEGMPERFYFNNDKLVVVSLKSIVYIDNQYKESFNAIGEKYSGKIYSGSNEVEILLNSKVSCIFGRNNENVVYALYLYLKNDKTMGVVHIKYVEPSFYDAVKMSYEQRKKNQSDERKALIQ